ncbi:MAG: LytTR family DNA-binding domain-containing protein [Bacteroidota bacterium]
MMKCLIVDDEALARKLLSSYVAQNPGLELVGKAEHPEEAQKILTGEKVDLMFLDIQMPRQNGIDFLSELEHPPLTIFTTAYTEYALKSYELDVIDYLVKPFPPERFQLALNKAREYWELRQKSPEASPSTPANPPLRPSQKDYFFIKADYKILKVRFADIIYIEGLREYIRIHTDAQAIITLTSLNKMMEILPASQFFRIHRSHIINVERIREIQGNMVVVEDSPLTVSKSQREAFFQFIQQHGLF